MKKATLSTTVLSLVFSSALLVNASAFASSEQLILACRELVGIYKNREEKNLLAAQTTSLSEALRAGYCHGVIEEYRRQRGCYGTDWFEAAKFIANQYNFKEKFPSRSQLLKQACNG